MNDPIVDEVRQVRDAHAARFNYDLDAIYRDIKEQEKKSGHQFVDGVARATVSKAMTGGPLSPSSDSTPPDPVPAAEL
jgi:hypothetical protein